MPGCLSMACQTLSGKSVARLPFNPWRSQKRSAKTPTTFSTGADETASSAAVFCGGSGGAERDLAQGWDGDRHHDADRGHDEIKTGCMPQRAAPERSSSLPSPI